MTYTIAQIIKIVDTDLFTLNEPTSTIETISIDSRHYNISEKTLFFCFDGSRIQAKRFIPELIHKGVKNIVLDKKYYGTISEQANFIYVEDVKTALQKLAQDKREKYHLNVIGITGSNGKTIVKEWLSSLLSDSVALIKSPKSYNSQIGVPLSIWNISKEHSLGIFEAGISTTDEMEALRNIIKPNIGILTNIGDAHSDGFKNNLEKLEEKLKLFVFSEVIIYNYNDVFIRENIQSILLKLNSNAKCYGWGQEKEAQLVIKNENSAIVVLHNNNSVDILLPTMEASFLENICHCVATLVYLGYSPEEFKEKLFQLKRIEMRLEVIEGIQNAILINDTYNSDIESLKTALNFLNQQAKNAPKTLILSDMTHRGNQNDAWNTHVLELLKETDIHQLVLIGTHFYSKKEMFNCFKKVEVFFYIDTETFLNHFSEANIKNHVVLIKGARVYQFEKIILKFQKKNHETYLQIHLNALKNNLNQFANLLKPKTKVMLMLKAHGYGLGSVEIAKLLEHQRADYLALAYIDEGIEIRNVGVKTPIMIMNPELNAVEKLYEYHLEPEIYSLNFFIELIQKVKQMGLGKGKKFPIHIKLETGMNRLGFIEEDIESLIALLKLNPQFEIVSIFSHLVASDEAQFDDFTRNQISRFEALYEMITNQIGYKPLRHILNSEGIVRHTEYQFEMVRLGIGLFGIDSSLELQPKLQNTVSLISKISQIKKVSKGETIGYSRKGVLEKDSTIGIVNIGYADGYSRVFGNGKASVWIKGQKVPTIGNICMDMTMVNLTETNGIQENDEVEIFGNHISLTELAETAQTIPYEILTSVSGRVQRVYYED